MGNLLIHFEEKLEENLGEKRRRRDEETTIRDDDFRSECVCCGDDGDDDNWTSLLGVRNSITLGRNDTIFLQPNRIKRTIFSATALQTAFIGHDNEARITTLANRRT